MTADHARYLRMKANPNKSPAAEQWVYGYEAGWQAAAERWMTTPQPSATPDQDDTTGWHLDDTDLPSEDTSRAA